MFFKSGFNAEVKNCDFPVAAWKETGSCIETFGYKQKENRDALPFGINDFYQLDSNPMSGHSSNSKTIGRPPHLMHIPTRRLLLFLIWMQVAAACSSDKQKLAGIWHSDMEAQPGFVTPFDFELRQDMLTDKWSGKFELPEMMAAGDLAAVAVKDAERGHTRIPLKRECDVRL